MSFDDLPESWSDHPVDPGRAADVVDLLVGHADREAGCLLLLLLDRERRVVQPCLVGEVGADADPARAEPAVRELASTTAREGGALLFARGRPGSVLLTHADRRWHETVLAACRDGGAPLVGAYLATPAAVRSFPPPLEAAVAS